MRIKLFLTAVITLLLSAGCSRPDGKVDAVPCRVKGERNWSFTNPKGDVSVTDEFKHRPTAVIEGRYWAQNDNGYWELYDASAAPVPIVDKEFRYVSNFYGGKAMVAERDKPVSIIDRDGNELVSLEKIGSVTPDQFTYINEGIAVFSVDSVQGVVNFDGELVVPAKYYYVHYPSSGRIIASSDYGIGFNNAEPCDSCPESTITVFDYTGKAVFDISSRKYSLIGDSYINGYLPVGKRDDDDKECWGLLNVNGEEVVAPSSSNRGLPDVSSTHYIFIDDENHYGVKAFDGTVVLKAKYAQARFLSDTRLAVTTSDILEDGEEPEWQIIDLEGNLICGNKFLDVSPVIDGRLFVKLKADRWAIMALDGEIDQEAQQFSEVYFDESQPCFMVASDFIDIAKLISGIGITPYGVDSLTFQSSVRQVLERQARYYSYSNQPHPANYSYTNEVNIFPIVEGEMITETIIFPSNLSHQTFRQEKVIDYVWGNYYWYHMNKIPTGYVFTSDRPSKFSLSFNNYGKLRGKLRTLYNDLVKHFTRYGSVITHNNAATLLDLGNGRTARIVLEPNSVSAVWGKLSEADKSIYSYEGNKEETNSMFADEMEEGY